MPNPGGPTHDTLFLPPSAMRDRSDGAERRCKYHRVRGAVLQFLYAGLGKNALGRVNGVAKRRWSGYRITGWRASGGKYSSWRKYLCYM